ncbi:hypothetical protein HY312_04340 [Candidatus Saccharibacteria bacterium]|nr:hypothetical protein [Candidatus Saccharibacteria bacterium]
MNYSNKKILFGTVFAVLLVVLTVGGMSVYTLFKTNTTVGEADRINKNTPMFVFDKSTMPGWYSGGNNWVDASSFTGDQAAKDDLPVADISLHQCKDLKKCDSSKDMIGGNCFAMLSYRKYPVEPEAAVSKKLKNNTQFGDMVVREVGVKKLSLRTSEGDRRYDLHQYDYEAKGDNSMMRGNALGFVSLGDAHVEVQTVCTEASQLDDALPVLSSVSLR